jgi:hypothetical protein
MQSERERLKSVSHLTLYFCENLHAKCYLNEQEMVITSQNLYETSGAGNREMAVLFSRHERVYKDAIREVDSIVLASKLVQGRPMEADLLSGAKAKIRSTPAQNRQPAGCCIRCSKRIYLNRESPLCPECYSSWAQWENADYFEQFCHRCGRSASVTFARPLCDECFRDSLPAHI